MPVAGYALFIFLQCTWGALQSFLGLLLFLWYIRKPHSFYRGCIQTKWPFPGGISLGLFIFTPDDNLPAIIRAAGQGGDAAKNALLSRLRVHEYGHCFQSLMLGPLYIIPGIWSALWSGMKRYRRLRSRYNVPYSFCPVEAWADRLGEKMTGEKSLG